MFRYFFVSFATVALLCQSPLHAQTVVASQDFDGGAVNLASGFTTTDNVDGGGGDFFGIGSIGAWPQADAATGESNIPFSIADDSVVDLSGDGTSPFIDDDEGIFGQARSGSDNFFAISDIRDEQPLTASWTFDLSSASGPFDLSVDIGQQSDGESFGGISTSDLQIQYSFDGGSTFNTAIDLVAETAAAGFTFRSMDSGLVPPVDGVLRADGATKTLVDTGATASDSYLNKSPASGAGAGGLDTFTAPLSGSGAQLIVQIAANDFPFEAIAFDNITVTSTVPEPAGFVLVLAAAMVVFASRRRG